MGFILAQSSPRIQVGRGISGQTSGSASLSDSGLFPLRTSFPIIAQKKPGLGRSGFEGRKNRP